MTPCERAFLDYFKTVCPAVHETSYGRVVSDEGILATWHEFFADWQRAVEWGQQNPTASTIASKVRRVKTEPTFLYSLNVSPWNERGRFGKAAKAHGEKLSNETEG